MEVDRARLRTGLGLAALPAAFLAVCFAWPVATIVAQGLGDADVWSLLREKGLRNVAWFTLWQATVSTGLTLAVGTPAAWVLARHHFPGRGAVRALLTAPFVLPAVVVGTAFLLVMDEGITAILGAHVFFNLAVVIRTLAVPAARLDARLGEAARTLGASPLAVARHVVLPLLRPALAAAASLVFLFCFTSYGVILILGGPRRSTLETEIQRQTAQLLRLDRAAVLALVQLTIVVIVLAWVSRWQERHTAAARRLGAVQTQPASLSTVLALAVPLALVAWPMWGLVRRADFGDFTRVRPGSGLAVSAFATVGVSLRTAAMAAAVALIVGALTAFAVSTLSTSRVGRVLDVSLMLPLGTSAVTLGFGFLITFDTAPFDWRSQWFAVPLVQALVGFPFVVRAMLPTLRSIDPRLREAAATMGASPLKVWRHVDFPLARRALAVGGAFAFAIAIGEFGATSFLARPQAPTMPVAIGRLLGRPGTANLAQAAALALVLGAVTALVMAGAERLTGEGTPPG